MFFFVMMDILGMKKINSVEKLAEMGKRVKETGLTYEIRVIDNDYQIEIYKGSMKIYEFVCDKVGSQAFLSEAVNF